MNITSETKKNLRIHLLKSNRYKKTRLEICLRREIDKKNLAIYAFLISMLNEANKIYPTRRNMSIRKEELYNLRLGCGLGKYGSLYKLYMELEFINPEYIEEKTYLNDIIDYFYDILYNCNFDNEKVFKMVKNNLILDIKASREFAGAISFENALKTMDKNSITAINEIGTIEEVEKITPEKLKEIHEDLFKTSMIDVFIMGNTDLELIKNTFLNKFTLNGIRKDINIYVDNKVKKKPIYKEENSNFDQTSLVRLYNVSCPTRRERQFVFPVLNYILSSGGLTSKLYRYVREENSLCYGIRSDYMKEDNLYNITSSLKYENVPKAIELIDKALTEMANGVFSEDDINEAKTNFKTSFALRKKEPNSLYFAYQGTLIFKDPSLEEKEKEYMTVTKEEIVTLAKKIKLNTTYILREAENGKD